MYQRIDYITYSKDPSKAWGRNCLINPFGLGLFQREWFINFLFSSLFMRIYSGNSENFVKVKKKTEFQKFCFQPENCWSTYLSLQWFQNAGWLMDGFITPSVRNTVFITLQRGYLRSWHLFDCLNLFNN